MTPLPPPPPEQRPSKVELGFLIFQVIIYAFVLAVAIGAVVMLWSFVDAVFPD